MHNFEFEHPYVFILLILIICIYKCPYPIQKIFFPHLNLFSKFSSFLNKEKLLYSIIYTLLIISLASPITYDSKLANDRKGRDLVFVLDSSGSMGESSYSEENPNKSKFDILKDIISQFVLNRFDDNVGVSVFGTYAFSSVPLTYDMKAVSFLLNFINVGIVGENTAIGDGIYCAIELLKHGKAKNKVIILVTDGYQNSGSHSIKEMVQKAKKLNIKIYTIGIGSNSDFDTKLLKKIASDTNAKMFTASNEDKLSSIYKELDSLEESKIRSQNYLNKNIFFSYPASIAVLLILYILTRKKGYRW